MKIKTRAVVLLIGVLALTNVSLCFADGSLDYQTIIYNEVLSNGIDPATALTITRNILTSCAEWGVDPFLVAAQFETESNFNMGSQSSAGAFGIAQLMPDTANGLAQQLGQAAEYAYTLAGNIDCGVYYIRQLLDSFAQYGSADVTLAIAAYNAGPNAITDGQVPDYPETLNYILKVGMYYSSMAGGGVLVAATHNFISTLKQTIFLHLDFDFAKDMRDIINLVSKQCTAGIKLIQDDVKWLFTMLIAIDLAVTASFKLLDSDDFIDLNWLLAKFLKYGFVLFMIINWGTICANTLQSYFMYMGAQGAGTDPTIAGTALSDPTLIVQKGAYIIGPVFTYISQYFGVKLMFGANIIFVLVSLLLALAILLCFIIIGCQVVLVYLEFYVIAALSVVSLSFAGLKQTKFFAEKGVGALFAVSVQLMIYSFYVVFLTNILQSYVSVQYDFFNYLHILLGSLAFVILGTRINRTALKLLSGSGPTL